MNSIGHACSSVSNRRFCENRKPNLTPAKRFLTTLEPKWKPARGTRAGFVNVPALVASEPGAEFSYEFDGTAVGLFLAAGYDSCILQFSIDDGEFQKIDSITRWSTSLHLPWPLILADGLKPGKHKITVQTTGDAKDRTALHIIHILEN